VIRRAFAQIPLAMSLIRSSSVALDRANRPARSPDVLVVETRMRRRFVPSSAAAAGATAPALPGEPMRLKATADMLTALAKKRASVEPASAEAAPPTALNDSLVSGDSAPPPSDPSPAAEPAVLEGVPACEPPDPERQRRHEEFMAAVKRVEAVLRQRWPEVFSVPRRPLKIGIHRDVLALAGDEVSPDELNQFFRWWVRRFDYADAVAHSEARIDLSGESVGVPSEREIRDAAVRVYGAKAERMLARIAARRSASIEDQIGKPEEVLADARSE
jgi:hypothetical protein